MDEADDKLRALFALDEPPARDPAFSTEVMARVLRHEFYEDVALVGAVALIGGVAFWAAWPVLQPAVVAVSEGLAPVGLAVALAACALAMLQRRPLAAES